FAFSGIRTTLFFLLVAQFLILPSPYLSSTCNSQDQTLTNSISRVKKIEELKDGEITTVAGNYFFDEEGVTSTITFEETGDISTGGKGILATIIRIKEPTHLAVDEAGNLFFTEREEHCIYRVDAKTGFLTIVAGNGLPGSSG